MQYEHSHSTWLEHGPGLWLISFLCCPCRFCPDKVLAEVLPCCAVLSRLPWKCWAALWTPRIRITGGGASLGPGRGRAGRQACGDQAWAVGTHRRQHSPEGRLYGASLAAVGAGSGIYHSRCAPRRFFSSFTQHCHSGKTVVKFVLVVGPWKVDTSQSNPVESGHLSYH